MAVIAVAWSASSCVYQTEIAIPASERRAGIGELRVDVREETRLTDAVRGAVLELVAPPNTDWRAPLRRVTADTSGRVTVGDLAPAHYTIRVWAAGYDTVTQGVRIQSGEIEVVRISLRDVRCTVVVRSSGPVCM